MQTSCINANIMEAATMHITGRVTTGQLAAAFLLGWALIVTGCGKAAQTVTEKVAQKAIEKSIAKDGGKADVKFDSKSGTVQVKGKDASGNAYEVKSGGDKNTVNFKQTGPDGMEMQIGENAKLPADFPKDVPVLDGLQLQMVQSSTEKKTFVVQGNSTTPIAKAAAFYKEKIAAQGWKELTTMNAGEMQTMQYEKDQRTLSVMLMKDGENTNVSTQTGPQ
jgi:hypothetical protein